MAADTVWLRSPGAAVAGSHGDALYGSYICGAQVEAGAMTGPEEHFDAEQQANGVECRVTVAREQLAELVNRAAYADQTTFLTRRGKRVAAIVPIDRAVANG